MPKMIKDEKITRLAIKTGLGVIATLLTYQLAKDALRGNTLSIAMLFTTLIYLNHLGKKERKAANVGQKISDAVVGASFMDTIKHYANNITAGAQTIAKEADKGLTALAR